MSPSLNSLHPLAGLSALVLCLPGGCAMVPQPFQLDGATTGSDTAAAVTVDAVSPAYSLMTGGDVVLVTGSGFDDSAQVFVGDAPAEITRGSADELELRVPAGASEGPADVRVDTDASSDTLTPGLWYFQDATGLDGLVGYLGYNEFVGGYWSSTTDPWVSALLVWAEPTTVEWWQTQGPGIDQCGLAGNFSSDEINDLGSLGLDELVMKSGANSITVPWTSSNSQFSLISEVQGYAFDAAYDLAEVTPADLPTFSVPELVRTPSADFVVTSPAIAGTTVPLLSRSPTFRWSGGSGDLVLILLAQLNSTGSSYNESIGCVATNDGSFTVPDLWSSWVVGRQIDIDIRMLRTADGVLPTDHSSSGVVGLWTKYAAAFAE